MKTKALFPLTLLITTVLFGCTGELITGGNAELSPVSDTGAATTGDAGTTTQPVCPNGIVEEGEICDGSCPTSCDDGNTCTTDTLDGSEDTCDAVCSHEEITACQDDDGCCPDACDSSTDSDCSASCGDGIVDDGETCDGNCPTACDDGDACTRNVLTGSPENCSVQCSTSDVTECVQEADGCCPPGCTANNDADCGAVCGNGVVEGVEECDGDCPADCDDGEACTNDEMSGSADACDVLCEHTDIVQCLDGDGCCPSTCNQSNDDDCPAECGNGVVEDGESCDGNCPADCDDGVSCTDDQMEGSADTCDVVCSHVDIVMCIDDDGCCPDACDETNDSDCSSVCGNGVVESGETCDPSSDCPMAADCDDGDACTQDEHVGSAQTCDAMCRHTDIVTCISGDGCCPVGCDEVQDLDCDPVCDNGVVESGETCDPIGSCPTSAADCDDGDACTGDNLSGDPDLCTAECTYTDVTACIDGDGCCPTGCDATTDSDCNATCDNDVVEDGETCDPIASCPVDMADCDDNDACTVDGVTGDPTMCTSECTHDSITSCVDNDGCCPSGCTMSNDSDCSIDCTDPNTWPADWKQLEDAIFDETNVRRTQPQTCGTTSYPAAPALVFDSRLREAARCHAMDMITNDFFSHTGSDGSSFVDRIAATGYSFQTGGENIATGRDTAVEILDQWMNSPGHCKNIMNSSFEDLGVAYVYDGTQQWYHFQVQVFATEF